LPTKAVFWTGPTHEVSAEKWLERASKESGSWWPHWLSWVQNRSGEKAAATGNLGMAEIPPLGEAPGQYVMEN
jgi:polyhydroxyalkanoate synthase